ncbi:monocarboxylate transporter 12-like [Haliotis rubra]|uniref:monocarboxylate transporter 12-like n=1 Tax=Haliotis rubra TaxID=36100 RepID=UPI001EE58D7C|nr:monocarboxylate transporter 12-like [Haliotis rubra]
MALHKNTDRGYAWVVLVSSWLQLVICGIVYYSPAVVTIGLLETMKEGVFKTSWVGSTLYGTYMFTAIGSALMDVSSAVIICHYFDKYLPLASGLQMSGGGAGLLMGAPIARALLDTFGLSGTFLVLGGIGANACVCGMLFRPSPHEQHTGTKSKETSGDVTRNLVDQEVDVQSEVRISYVQRLRSTVRDTWSLVFNLSFMLYVLSYTFWGFGESIIYVHLTNFAESKGTSQQNSAMLFTAIGVTSIIARVLAGFAGTDPAIGVFMLHTGMVGVAGVLLMLCPLLSSSLTRQFVFSSLYGIFSGGPMALVKPIIVDLVGVKQLATGYGVVNFIGGLGLLLGPPFAGR